MPYSNILWVKLEKRLLNDYRHYSLPDDAQLIFLKLLLIAAETDNKIPKDLEILSSIFRSTITSKRVGECIKLIKTNFPKFKEKAHYYYFNEWKQRHNWIAKKELLGSSDGVTSELLEEKRIEKKRILEVIAYFASAYQELKDCEYLVDWKKEIALTVRFLKRKEKPDFKELIDWFLSSPKGKEHPSISACFSTDTLNNYRLKHKDE